MSENPFKIIGVEEGPPEDLRAEVMGSVNLAVLGMRVARLFLADYATVLFDKFSILRPPPGPDEKGPDNDLP